MKIIVDDVELRRDGATILSVPHLEIDAAQRTALLGPNGAGKTTLLRLLCGLEQPDRGTVTVERSDEDRAPPVATDFAFAFQRPVMLGGTVRRNLELGLELRQIAAAERCDRIARVLDALGISHLEKRRAGRLSQGEAQRVNLARALVLRAPVTLLDEPLAGMDPEIRASLLDELPALLDEWSSCSVLVTHDRNEALLLASQLVILVGGVVHAAGSLQSLTACPPDAQAARVLGYTIHQRGDERFAVGPGSWSLADGGISEQLEVLRVLRFGEHLEIVGRVAGAMVRLRVAGAPRPPRQGETIAVCASHRVPL